MANLSQMGNKSILSLIKIKQEGKVYPFNLTGLYKLHEDIFKYYDKIESASYRPHQIRSVVPNMQIWSKEREIPGWGVSNIIYSDMSKNVQIETELFLKQNVRLDKLKKMRLSQISKVISDVYIMLDYLHPFYDGNSRTIREFTRQICFQAGYMLLWENCNRSLDTRKELYLARDFAVNNMALKHTTIPELQYDIKQYMEKQKSNKPLFQIIKENLHQIRQHTNER